MYMYIMYMYRLIWLQLKPSHCRQQRGGGGHIRTCGGGGGNLPVTGEEYIFAERHFARKGVAGWKDICLERHIATDCTWN